MIYSKNKLSLAAPGHSDCVVGNTEVEFSLAGCPRRLRAPRSVSQVKFRPLQIMRSGHSLVISGPEPVARNDLHFRMLLQPLRQLIGRALRQQVRYGSSFQIDQDRAVGLSLLPRPVIDTHHPWALLAVGRRMVERNGSCSNIPIMRILTGGEQSRGSGADCAEQGLVVANRTTAKPS